MNGFLIVRTQGVFKYLKDAIDFLLDFLGSVFLFELYFIDLDFQLVGLHFSHGFLVEVLGQAALFHPEEVHEVVGVVVVGYVA